MKPKGAILSILFLVLGASIGVLGGPSYKQSCPSNNSPRLGSSPMGLPPHLKLRGGEVLHIKLVEELDQVLMDAANRQQLTIIDFTAVWCGPCKVIAPIFEEMSDDIPDVVFAKVDVDEASEIAMKYSVSAMPTFVFIKGGEVIDRLMGANPVVLREMIEQYM